MRRHRSTLSKLWSRSARAKRPFAARRSFILGGALGLFAALGPSRAQAADGRSHFAFSGGGEMSVQFYPIGDSYFGAADFFFGGTLGGASRGAGRVALGYNLSVLHSQWTSPGVYHRFMIMGAPADSPRLFYQAGLGFGHHGTGRALPPDLVGRLGVRYLGIWNSLLVSSDSKRRRVTHFTFIVA